MKKSIAAVSEVSDGLAKILCVVLFTLLVGIVGVSVLFRYVLIIPMVWAEQAACYISIWIAFIAASLAFRRRAHIGLDILVNAMSAGAAGFIRMVSNVLVIVFLIFMIYWGIKHCFEVRTQMSPVVFGISMTWPYLAIPIGGIFMLIQEMHIVLNDMP
jgi:TRAP-type C4-dicarboxylate transport system permease small subunit